MTRVYCIPQILVRDPRAVLVLQLNPQQPITQRSLMHRLRGRLTSAVLALRQHQVSALEQVEEVQGYLRRVVYIPPLDPGRYTQAVCSMHVNLDLFPFGGGVTVMDSCFCDSPVVTCAHLQVRVGISGCVWGVIVCV